MAISVRLDESFVKDTKPHAEKNRRSVPKQIEHWATIGKLCEENPDLPYEFIRDSIEAKNEIPQ